jgi:hypothetical protein
LRENSSIGHFSGSFLADEQAKFEIYGICYAESMEMTIDLLRSLTDGRPFRIRHASTSGDPLLDNHSHLR